ncbi:MAG: 50S ribosomal protein L32 [Clostridiales bacterium]|nr:50S ribosomal protein L32 [Clostridiales bacterium]
MAVPKGKVSRARGRKGRTHWKLQMPAIVACAQCKQMRLAHRVCKNCGYYNGVEVIKMDEGAKA